MKYLFIVLFFANFAMASELLIAQTKQEQTKVTADEINFQEWESEFDNSVQKAKVRVRKCEAKSRNCQFEKFQALDPAFDMVH